MAARALVEADARTPKLLLPEVGVMLIEAEDGDGTAETETEDMLPQGNAIEEATASEAHVPLSRSDDLRTKRTAPPPTG